MLLFFFMYLSKHRQIIWSSIFEFCLIILVWHVGSSGQENESTCIIEPGLLKL
jgi:hypothetical protein